MALVVVLLVMTNTNMCVQVTIRRLTLCLATIVEDRPCTVVQAVRCLSVRTGLLANMSIPVLRLDVV
jgi:hypothetical protein